MAEDQEEPEITPDMMAAGRLALGFADLEDLPENIVTAIYVAMVKAREAQHPGIEREPKLGDR